MSFYSKFDKYRGADCQLLGFGRSTMPLCDILLSVGANITVRDKNKTLETQESAIRYRGRGVKFILGEGYLCGLAGDYVFRSPGIRPDLPEIAAACDNGATLSSEIEVLMDTAPCKIFAITGSDGKTTTTTITHLLFKNQLEREGYRAFVGGNIGHSLLPELDAMTENDVAVLELSSFQLMTGKKSPTRAAITNISPNHLDWHTDMQEYIDAKCKIFNNGGCEAIVLNADNKITRQIAENVDCPVIYFSGSRSSYDDIVHENKKGSLAVFERDGYIVVSDGEDEWRALDTSKIKVIGRHNVENYMTAIGLTWGYISPHVIEAVAESFTGVKHRIQLVSEICGVRYINSSIDSSPTRTAAAIKAIGGSIVAICGGYDKNIPFDILADSLTKNARAVVLTGATAEKIYDEILACPTYDKDKLSVFIEKDFYSAVIKARDVAKSGDSVVLTPACASFDAFRNFEERGDRFIEIVRSFEK